MPRLRLLLFRLITGASLAGSVLLSGCAAAQDDAPDYSGNSDEIEIGSIDDFDEPLSPYGEWVDVGSYGRCWHPNQVDRDWRPYADGYWVRTDAGWYWASDEPWAWAAYHYGRWDFAAGLGWYWVPRTRWAPAWVSWRSGGDYVGWAPLPPSARVEVGIGISSVEAPEQRYVFVPVRRFAERVRPTTVIVNRPTIIRQTVNITKIKVVNKTVVNEGPRVDVIEKVSGHKVTTAPVVQVRREQEARVLARHPSIARRPRINQPATTAEARSGPAAHKPETPRESRPVTDQPGKTAPPDRRSSSSTANPRAPAATDRRHETPDERNAATADRTTERKTDKPSPPPNATDDRRNAPYENKRTSSPPNSSAQRRSGKSPHPPVKAEPAKPPPKDKEDKKPEPAAPSEP